jgi:hypothetical protein
MTVPNRAVLLSLALTLLSATAGFAQSGDQPLGKATTESGLSVEVLEIRRDKNEMLTIRWRYRNPTKQTIELIATTPRFRGTSPPPNTAAGFYKAVYYVEGKLQTGQANKHYIVIEEGTKKRYARDLGNQAVKLRPNQQYEVWAKFSLPATATEKTICLALPGTPLLENLPIQEGLVAKKSND